MTAQFWNAGMPEHIQLLLDRAKQCIRKMTARNSNRDTRTLRMNSRFETSAHQFSTNTLDLSNPKGTRTITRFGSNASSLDQSVTRRSSFCVHHTHLPADSTNNLLNSWLFNETTDQRGAYDQTRHDQIHMDLDLYVKLMLPSTSIEPGRSSSVFSSSSRRSKRESPKEEDFSDLHSSWNRPRARAKSASASHAVPARIPQNGAAVLA
ncbi:hypothetical protein BJ742DRAFT_787568 [Cladochytrium replicatum]|nr:hypothetical protein BJ742DRAFT_787568 [Cladochytrium replicatum]